jgi:bifunctional non-homologous end joining protein LigD
VKADGFRGLLYVALGHGRLISRNGCELRRFRPLADSLTRKLKVQSAILDGEIVGKDKIGRPIFLDLMRRRGDASYTAFDLLWLNGQDLRSLIVHGNKKGREG